MSLLRQMYEERRRARRRTEDGRGVASGVQKSLQDLDALQRQVIEDQRRRGRENKQAEYTAAEEAYKAQSRPLTLRQKEAQASQTELVNQKIVDQIPEQLKEFERRARAHDLAQKQGGVNLGIGQLRLGEAEGKAGREGLARDAAGQMGELLDYFESVGEEAPAALSGGDLRSSIDELRRRGAAEDDKVIEQALRDAYRKAFYDRKQAALGIENQQSVIDKRARPRGTGVDYEPRLQRGMGKGDRIPRGASFKAARAVAQGDEVYGVGPVNVSVGETARHLGWGVPKGKRGEVKISPQQKEFTKQEKVLIAADKALSSLDKGVDTGRFKAWLNGVLISVGADPPELTGSMMDMARVADLALREASGAAAPYQEQLKIAKFTGNQTQDEDTARRLMLSTRDHYRNTLRGMRASAAEEFALSPSAVDHYGRDYSDPVSIIKRYGLLDGKAREIAKRAIQELGGLDAVKSASRADRRALSTLMIRLWANK